MADNWWTRQFQNIGVPVVQQPPQPAPVQRYATPSEALAELNHKPAQGQGRGTYGDILNNDPSGYQPDPRKYGVLKDTSVDFYCPNCDSPNYFSRKAAMRSGGRAPAPHCFDCGYNGESAYSQEPLDLGKGVPVAGMARGLTDSHIASFRDPTQVIAHIS